MPELPVKEGRLSELHLPEIKRDDIVRSLSEIQLPDVDLTKLERPKIDLPDSVTKFEWSDRRQGRGRRRRGGQHRTSRVAAALAARRRWPDRRGPRRVGDPHQRGASREDLERRSRRPRADLGDALDRRRLARDGSRRADRL